MTETNHWKLGLFVFASVSLAVVALIALGAGGLRRDVREMVTYFDESVQGLDENSPVKARGVTIGNVSAITIAPDRRNVEVHFELYTEALGRLGIHELQPGTAPAESEEVRKGMRVQLASVGITGLKFLQLDFFDPKAFPVERYEFELPWNFLPSAPSTLKNLEDGLRDSVLRLPGALDEASRIMSTVNEKLGDADVEGLSRRGKALLDDLQRLVDQGDREDIVRRFGTAVDEAREASAAIRAVIRGVESEDGALERVLRSLESVTKRFERAVDEAQIQAASTSLRETTEAYGALAYEANGLLVDLRRDLDALSEALEALRALAVYLERDPGALLRGRTTEETVGRNPPK